MTGAAKFEYASLGRRKVTAVTLIADRRSRNRRCRASRPSEWTSAKLPFAVWSLQTTLITSDADGPGSGPKGLCNLRSSIVFATRRTGIGKYRSVALQFFRVGARMKIRLMAASGILCLLTTPGLCETQDCSKALIVATTDIRSSVATQLSAAYNMSEGEWTQRQTSAGASATIYGVPYSASYADFKSNVRQRAEAFHLDRFEQRSYAYATSGLNDASLDAYKACLRSAQRGFDLFAGDTSEDTYRIHLVNAPVPGLDPHIVGALENPINVAEDSLSYLRQSVGKLKYAEAWDKDILIQPKDPNKEVSFTVDFGDVTDKNLLLPPLKTKPVRIDLSNKGSLSLMHRVHGVPSQDCASPTHGGGGLPVNYISDDRACISTDGKNLPANFKIDPRTVSITAPSESCAWVVCPEAGNEEANKRDNNVLDATQCAPKPAATSFCFRVRMQCPNAYDVTCTNDWQISRHVDEGKTDI